MKLTFTIERETKNTVRYQETSEVAVIGTLYVHKWALKTLKEGDYPKELLVVISVPA